MSGIVRAVNQSCSKLGDTPLVRLDLFESLHSLPGLPRNLTHSGTSEGGQSEKGQLRALTVGRQKTHACVDRVTPILATQRGGRK